jgi:hypothetical protein
MNRQPPYQVIQPVRPYQYVSQVHTIHPVRLIATPPMTPFEYDSRSVVDNFSEASYENYRNNHVFNQTQQRNNYSTFGLGPGLRTIPDNSHITPPDSPVMKPKSRRQSKYVEAVVNGPPAPPQKKEDDVVIITLPGPVVAQAQVVASAGKEQAQAQVKELAQEQVKEQVKEKVKILKKETNEPPKTSFKHLAIDGDFKPAPPMKLSSEQFKILDDSARKYYSDEKATKPVEEPVVKKYVPPMQKNKAEEKVCAVSGASAGADSNTITSTNTGYIANTGANTGATTCAKANIIGNIVNEVGSCVGAATDTGSTPFISKLLHTPNFYGIAKDDTEPIIYNTVNEKRTKKYKFITMEQVVCIEGKLYYIPGQVVTMEAAEYQHTMDHVNAA